jgi:hypothetical protein
MKNAPERKNEKKKKPIKNDRCAGCDGMDEQLYRVVRQRVVALMSLIEHENDAALAPTLELELRFGVLGDRGQFVAGLPNGLWYALFQHMSEAPSARIEAGFSMVERDEDAADERIVHTSEHCACVRERKRPVLASVDLPLFEESRAVVRVAASRETRLANNVCAHARPGDTPRHLMRYRERRGIHLVRQGVRSCWRFDFTRIDDKSAYELELELDLQQAQRQTSHLEPTTRIDAIMRQLGSLVVSLRHALERADQTHRLNVAHIAAQREQAAARFQQHL